MAANPKFDRPRWLAYDASLADRTATAYEELPSFDTTDRTLDCYRAFFHEIDAQCHALRAAGYGIVVTSDDPYPDSSAMIEDVKATGTLRVYDGGTDHPLATKEQTIRFRFVHDLLAHAFNRFPFGPRGEFNACIAHALTLSYHARLALYTETHGQNSYYQRHGQYAPQKAAILPLDITGRLETTLVRVSRDEGGYDEIADGWHLNDDGAPCDC